MSEEKKFTELSEEATESVDGGTAGVYCGKRIITAFGKACGDYSPGRNFFNQRVIAISGTCGACRHMVRCDGWHVCDARIISGGE
ncbi:hypothetical protein [Qiania dongpingensis]|uniref:Uncharacterized protein n=1 Tax=Qiania dongpingensis TaxID=2763669 RepID=A0A7G9G3F6_9FIRM|nr:hypothetical protein [Qiania dongpingensis]QNM05338.1 hypothetical protein H9Q78_13010 [Qiania dongpingensis]